MCAGSFEISRPRPSVQKVSCSYGSIVLGFFDSWLLEVAAIGLTCYRSFSFAWLWSLGWHCVEWYLGYVGLGFVERSGLTVYGILGNPNLEIWCEYELIELRDWQMKQSKSMCYLRNGIRTARGFAPTWAVPGFAKWKLLTSWPTSWKSNGDSQVCDTIATRRLVRFHAVPCKKYANRWTERRSQVIEKMCFVLHVMWFLMSLLMATSVFWCDRYESLCATNWGQRKPHADAAHHQHWWWSDRQLHEHSGTYPFGYLRKPSGGR